MAYIFLDESGDLGFDPKKKSSKYFVVTFLFVENKGPVEKAIKKVARNLSRRELKKYVGVLHACKEKPKTITKVLSLLSEKDISILSIYLNKKKVYTKLQDEKHVLYNYVSNILLDRILTKKLIPIDSQVHLIASRRETNKFLNKNFENYLKKQVKNNHQVDIHIEIKTPSSEKGLQAVDFVCWAIYQKRERGDESYYNLIKQKIVEESPLFP
jgi:undecaprenyl pyrophosphate synthase